MHHHSIIIHAYKKVDWLYRVIEYCIGIRHIFMHLFLFIPFYTNISQIFSSLLYYIYENTCDILLIFSQFPFINEQ